eukprot:TRINITY_DN3236_c0_g1_i1.p1 TRINITY_DN3236_c0_g1~~TRINITY_DN3236_c0_g1_i1.p1  ORF type:complete len:360 (+),score=68.71 TRINITY_DN3236_c0_g1_i1:64-1143(+)
MKKSLRRAAAAVVGSTGVVMAAGAGSRVQATETPEMLFQFGVIADVQYADIDNASNFSGTSFRRYRESLVALKYAVDAWIDASPQLKFVMDLGDIIDQVNETKGESIISLNKVLSEFSRIAALCPVYHLVGNHELYNFGDTKMVEVIPGMTGSNNKLYHSFTVDGVRMVVLNSYDEHVIIDVEAPANVEETFQKLEKVNPNNLRGGRGAGVNWAANMTGEALRFMPYNGGVLQEQLDWLSDTLDDANEKNEKVIVFTHVPVYPGSACATTLIWNYKEVVPILQKHENVVAVFTGHDHKGGYAIDETGIHYVTLPSPLSVTGDIKTAHAVVEVYPDRLFVRGEGVYPSRELPFQHKLSKA